MIFLRLIFLSVAIPVVCAAACLQSQSTQSKNYPALIKDSPDRRAKAEREWRRMLDAYNVPQTPPDLYPITYTPRSLLGVAGGIKLTVDPISTASDPLTLRELMRSFIDRWRDMIGADPTALSLVSSDQSGQIKRFTYKQANYALPIAAPSGELNVVLSGDGRLMQLDDRLIPVIELPIKPTVEKESIPKRIVGRTFTYTDFSGRQQRASISNEAEVAVKQLVVLPLQKAEAIEIHLAWEVAAGGSLSWTLYVDAISGEELKVVQNFQT